MKKTMPFALLAALAFTACVRADAEDNQPTSAATVLTVAVTSAGAPVGGAQVFVDGHPMGETGPDGLIPSVTDLRVGIRVIAQGGAFYGPRDVASRGAGTLNLDLYRLPPGVDVTDVATLFFTSVDGHPFSLWFPEKGLAVEPSPEVATKAEIWRKVFASLQAQIGGVRTLRIVGSRAEVLPGEAYFLAKMENWSSGHPAETRYLEMDSRGYITRGEFVFRYMKTGNDPLVIAGVESIVGHEAFHGLGPSHTKKAENAGAINLMAGVPTPEKQDGLLNFWEADAYAYFATYRKPRTTAPDRDPDATATTYRLTTPIVIRCGGND